MPSSAPSLNGIDHLASPTPVDEAGHVQSGMKAGPATCEGSLPSAPCAHYRAHDRSLPDAESHAALIPSLRLRENDLDGPRFCRQLQWKWRSRPRTPVFHCGLERPLRETTERLSACSSCEIAR